jgi:cellulose synthase/poly-beta-1,6-N-acetylglucosamine synthase-like glycosyltransferase
LYREIFSVTDVPIAPEEFTQPSPSTQPKRHNFSEANEPFTRKRPSTNAPLLGELAVNSGMIDQTVLDHALAQQQKSGSRLGEIMVSAGYLRPTQLTRLLSIQTGVTYIDLRLEPGDDTLASAADLDFYISEDCLPWRWVNREMVYVAADPMQAKAAIESHEDKPCIVLFASPKAIRHAIRERFHIELSARARLKLAEEQPESSASHKLSLAQRWVFVGMIALIAGFGWFAPKATAIMLNILFGLCFLAIAALKGLSIFVGLYRGETEYDRAFARQGERNDKDLPIYTILVPLFREAAVLPILTDSLRKLDYPTAKLQILLVFEETDVETYEAAKALDLPGNIEFIRVPYSIPLTKPKACNYALPFVRGEFLVVYDAEDMPEPDQLKRALAAFQHGARDLACVQAHLNYYNCFENWLTRQFTLEYAAFFDLLLPTLEKLCMPIPLGGTSTHFRTSLLRLAGAWDPFNVTEDADLGMRFAMLGWHTGVISSTTYEEANCRQDNWTRQRSRWIKGWMQTYLVRMRHPVQLFKALGLRGFLGFQLVIGGFSLSSLVHPLFYGSFILTMLAQIQLPPSEAYLTDQVSSLTIIAAFNLLVLFGGYSLSILAGMTAVAGRGLNPLILSSLAMPAYWLLISFAAYKALFQLFSRPFHWEKTEHGISRFWAQKRADALNELTHKNEERRHTPVTWR